MRAKETARCTNCRRLQTRVDALEAELAALKAVSLPVGPATRRGPQGLLHLLQAPVLRPRQAAQAATTEGQGKRRIGGQPGHPKHDRVAFPPEAVNAGTFDHRIDSCPGLRS